MIVDIKKIAEDTNHACYICSRTDYRPSIILVDKSTITARILISGDPATAAGALAKVRREVRNGHFPDSLQLATG